MPTSKHPDPTLPGRARTTGAEGRPIRRRRSLWTIVAAGMVASFSFAAPVQAATNYSWDGVYPVGTVCARDAFNPVTPKKVYDDRGRIVGLIELRYSVKCHTAWARITNYENHIMNHQYPGRGIVHRAGGSEQDCWVPEGRNQYCVTKMLYDKDPLKSFARAEIGGPQSVYAQEFSAQTRSY